MKKTFILFSAVLSFFLLRTAVFSANFTAGSDTLENTKHSAQSIHKFTFTTTKAIPSDGEILITIPSVDLTGQTNDGIADSADNIRSGGFDLNSLSAPNINIASSGCVNNWGVGAITEGTSTSDHLIRLYRTTDSCAAGSTITVTVGDVSKKIINPAPLTTPSSDGSADVYTLHIRSRDGSANKLDQLDVRVAILSPASVSATVGESFSFDLSGVPLLTKVCNTSTDITTTATAVPWGTINRPFTFRNAAHLITVSTNAKDGYVVTVSEDDQLRRSSAACTGPYSNSTQGCIPDTTCDNGRCTDRVSSEWTDRKKAGFGFSLQNLVDKNTVFSFNDAGGTFMARQFPDREAGEENLTISKGNSPTLGSSAYVCYRIGIADTQSAGFYTNQLLYTASPKF